MSSRTTTTPSRRHRRHRRHRRAAALLAGLWLATAAALGPAPAASAAGHRVMIHDYAYSPASLTLDVGDSVTWTNMDSAPHDVTVTRGPASFHSPLLGTGQSWTYTFTVAGPYTYICSVHPDMQASVAVAASSSPEPAPATASASASTTASTDDHQHRAHQAPTKRRTAGAGGTQGEPSVADQAVAPTAAPTESISPLLFVAGGSVAVVVFCLLLLASRPQESHPG